MKIWTDSELEFLQIHVVQNMDTMDIYDAYKAEFGTGHRTYDSVQKKVKQFRDVLRDDVLDEDEEDNEINILSRASEIMGGGRIEKVHCTIPLEVKQALKKARPLFIDQILEAAQKYKPRVPAEPIKSKNTTLVAMLSDTHVGQQSSIYGLGVCKERLHDWPVQLYQKNRHLKDIDEIVILMIGDMVEGEDIFPTQTWHVQCSALRQIHFGTLWILEALLSLKELFKVPIRIITVPGNHGRVSKSANEKTNWDNFLYQSLESCLSSRQEEGLSIDCNFEPFREFVIKDRKGQIYHEGTKHTGTPAMREKIAGWAYNSKASFVAHGHWHEWHVGSWQDIVILANGSMCGPNDLSQRMAQMTPARQGYFLITPGEALWGFGFTEWPHVKIEEDEVSFNEKEHQSQDGEDSSID